MAAMITQLVVVLCIIITIYSAPEPKTYLIETRDHAAGSARSDVFSGADYRANGYVESKQAESEVEPKEPEKPGWGEKSVLEPEEPEEPGWGEKSVEESEEPEEPEEPSAIYNHGESANLNPNPSEPNRKASKWVH